MKKPRSLWLAVISFFLARQQAQASQQQKNQPLFDPVEDFRPPYSLMELLHEGLNTVLIQLQYQVVDSDQKNSIAKEELTRLSKSLDGVSMSTRYNQVIRSDKEFLQSMIDRIDSLIDQLESNSSDKDSLETTRSASAELREKIELL